VGSRYRLLGHLLAAERFGPEQCGAPSERIHTNHPCPGSIPSIRVPDAYPPSVSRIHTSIPSPGLHPGLVCVDPLGQRECCRSRITHLPPELRNRPENPENPHECLRCEASRSAWAVAKRTPGIHYTLNRYAGQSAANGQITHTVTHKCWWLHKQASGGPFWGFWRLRRVGIRNLGDVGYPSSSTLPRGFVRTISPAR